MGKINLFHVVQCAGGVDCYLRMLLQHMDRNKFRQTLVCSFDYPKDKYMGLVDEFIQIDMCNSLSVKKDFAAIAAVRKLIKQYRPDIIYCHSSKAGGIARIANVGLHIPLVYNPHGWAFNMKGSGMKSLIYKWLERMLAPLTDLYVAISNREKLSAIEHHITRTDKIKVIFNGIESEKIAMQARTSKVTRASLGIPDDSYVVGMVGRISMQKAPDTFIKVAAALKDVLPRSYFMIVGDGDGREEIERLVTQYGLENRVLITGCVCNPIDYANLFDQAVLLSRWEGFGLVLAEYMELGKPIVATAVDAIPDLITDGHNGLLAEVDNVTQIVEAIQKLYADMDLKNRMVHHGLLRVEAFFNMERVACEHENLFIKMKGL